MKHDQILEFLVQAGCEQLAPLSMRCHLLRMAVLWRIRATVPELTSVFPEDLLLWHLNGSVAEDRLWGGIANSGWNGTREDLWCLWEEYKQEYMVKFKIEGNVDLSKDDILREDQDFIDI
jgi:hypothetical protein